MSFRQDPAPQDWPAIAACLAGHGHVLDPAQPPRQFAGGLANLNYLVRLDGAPAVFRRPPAGALGHGASDMGREAKLLGALAPVWPLAPTLLHVCADAGVIGVPFQLLEWRAGVAVGSDLPALFGPGDAGWMLAALCGALASLHALDPAGIGLGDLGRPTGFVERQLRGWTKRAAAAFGVEAPAALEALLARLGDLLPADAAARLLHMDPKFDNLLLDPASRRATALIDWDMGTLGPPAFDVAVLLSYWIEPGDPPDTHALAAVPSLLPGWPSRADVVAAYAAAAGGVPPDLGWHLALARLRLATAWMQLYRLWQQGSLSGARYSGFATLADALLAHALDRFGDVT
jgi:aminoglycoside phosphotransferase (APT) family kinase protein